MSQVRTFAYQLAFQEAIVGWMLSDSIFVEKCIHAVKPEYFADPVLRKIVTITYDYVRKYKQKPNKHDMVGIFNDTDSRICLERIMRCEQARLNYSPDVMKDELEKFAKIESYRDILLHSEKLYQQNRPIEAVNMAYQQIEKAAKINLKSDPTVQFDVEKHLDLFESADEECLTIGDPDFDEMIKEGSRVTKEQLEQRKKFLDKSKKDEEGLVSGVATGKDAVYVWSNNLNERTRGSLVRGDTTVVIGATNSGKTTFVNTVVAINLFLGKKVLYIFHEDDEMSMVQKMVKTMLGATSVEMRGIRDNKKLLEEFKAIFEMCKKNLTMLPVLDPSQMSIENVIAQAKFLNEKMKQENKGQGYDLIVDDYPRLLWSERIRNIKIEKRHEIYECYFQFMQLAKALNCHILLPAQSNREGAKKQFQNGKGNLMGNEDVGEAYDVVQSADNVITLNRTEKQVASKWMTLFVTKTRKGEKFFKYHTQTDFARSRTHGFGLMSVIERPGRPLTQTEMELVSGTKRTDDLLEKVAKPENPDNMSVGEVENDKSK